MAQKYREARWSFSENAQPWLSDDREEFGTARVGRLAKLDPSCTIMSRSNVGNFCHVGAGAVVGEDASLRLGVAIAAGVTIKQGAILRSFCHVGEGATIGEDCLVGRGTKVGAWARVEAGATLGDWVHVEDNAVVKEGTEVPAWTTVHRTLTC